MHDPQTVAFDIPWRFRTSQIGGKPWRYWVPLITIWHVDPERDGSDDSCGWSRPGLTDRHRKIIADMVDWDAKFPYYSSPSIELMSVVVDPAYAYRQMGAGDCVAHVYSAWRRIAWEINRRRKLSVDEIEDIFSLGANPEDNLRSVLAGEGKPQERVCRFLTCVMRAYLRHHRPWYRHPRWHLWHWKIQIHPLLAFKRWAFSRCCKCGKGFSWGYSPTTNNWHGTGPRWFRSEEGVFHSECDASVRPGATA